MTAPEFAQVAERMTGWWPHTDWDRWVELGALDQMASDLADLEASVVMAACETLARDGREFPPNAGQIRGAAVELALDVPEWGDVCRIITRAGYSVTAPDTATWSEQRQLALAGMPTLVRGFVDQVGWREACQAGSPDRTAQAQVREKWLAYARQAERDVRYAGLTTAGLPALERANRRAPRLLADSLRAALPQETG